MLECYVLSSIGELQPANQLKLEPMAPKLRDIYKLSGEWREVIAQVMSFSPELDDELRRMWSTNQQLAGESNEELMAEDFARMIVDDNFSK